MTKEHRAQVLRERMRAVRGYDLPPLPKAKAKVEPAKRGFHFNPIAPMRMEVGPRYDWVKRPDEAAEETLKVKRRRGTHALAKIASKAPGKLVKAFSSAEAFAASRKRQ